MKNLYAGAAGVLWALDELRGNGHAETELDLADLALRNLELFRNRPDFMKIDVAELRESSLVFGETGILLVACTGLHRAVSWPMRCSNAPTPRTTRTRSCGARRAR